jgi:hypothetical protein
MEIIIAILWYLQLLLPGVNYTQADINGIMQDNQKVIQEIRKDAQQTNRIMDCYNSNGCKDVKKIIEEWDDPVPDPILD